MWQCVTFSRPSFASSSYFLFLCVADADVEGAASMPSSSESFPLLEVVSDSSLEGLNQLLVIWSLSSLSSSFGHFQVPGERALTSSSESFSVSRSASD